MYKTKIAIPVASLALLMLFTSTFIFSTSYTQFAGQVTRTSNNTGGITHLSVKNGTLNVVQPTSFNASPFTNASGTVGHFAVYAAGKPSFDQHLHHKLGFNAVSAFNVTTFPSTANNTVQGADNNLAGTLSANGTSNAKILYVCWQETSGIHTTITRLANKACILENILYPMTRLRHLSNKIGPQASSLFLQTQEQLTLKYC